MSAILSGVVVMSKCDSSVSQAMSSVQPVNQVVR